MTRRRSYGYTLSTSRTAGSYRGWERVVGAAGLVAEQLGAAVSMVNDDSGEMWDVSADGRVSNHPV